MSNILLLKRPDLDRMSIILYFYLLFCRDVTIRSVNRVKKMEHKHYQAVMNKLKIQKRTASPIQFVQSINRHIKLHGRSRSHCCRNRNRVNEL